MTEKQKAIEIKNISYNFRSDWIYKKIAALKDISLDIMQGESFGYLGPNGAGKTTTIKCILGLIKPSSGQIKIFGVDSRQFEARQSVGYLPEQPYFYDHLSVQEIMAMYARLAGVENKLIKPYIKEALEKVKIADRAKSRMRTLSKGLTQKVAMAQAIVAKPKVLILDEPFSGLDPIGRKEFKDLIFELKSLGTTILMSSHILSDVEFLCDRASITVKGELKGVFDLSKLSDSAGSGFELILRNFAAVEGEFIKLCDSIHKEHELLRLVFQDKEKAMQALRKSLDSQVTIEAFNSVHPGLEDVFVKLAAG